MKIAWKRHKQQRRQQIKISVLQHYSNGTMKCSFCGCSDVRVLTIDHVNGKGAEHRRKIKRSSGTAFYHWLYSHNFPEGFQVLCMNCQFIKRFNRNETRKPTPQGQLSLLEIQGIKK